MTRLPVLLLCLAVDMAALPASAHAAASCGNGVVEGGEECDGGPGGIFVDGDPERGACDTGSRCYFRFTCCKFNCQYVGTPGAPCEDGNQCTGPDTCDQLGTCHHGPAFPDGSPCSDGLFCDGTETCHSAVCTASTGDPCPQTACTACQEDHDNCFKPAGLTCSDGSACAEGGTCDGSGHCRDGVFVDGPCDDGQFCNGADSCASGACSVHAGSPCSGADGDADCSESCDEQDESCDAADPDGAACDDGLFCDGSNDSCAAGVCEGGGAPACDDTNGCTTDSCNENADHCTNVALPDGTGCDDANLCTLEDVCSDGACAGSPVLLRELCPWTLVLREDEDGDVVRTGLQVAIDGDSCGGTFLMGSRTRIVSDLASGDTLEETPLRVAPDSVIGGDIASAGGGAKAFPRSGDLPYVEPAAALLAPGSLTPRSDGLGDYDLTGASALAGDCIGARNAYAESAAALDGLPATAGSLPGIRVGGGETFRVTVANAGSLNVLDVDGPLKLATDAVLELDGGGDPASLLVLRVSGAMKLQLRSVVALTGSLTPEHTLIYVKGRACRISDLTLGGGSLLCSPARVRFGHAAAWIGALFADGRSLKIGDKSVLLYAPFRGF